MKIFDPRIIAEDNSNQRLWNTQSVMLADNGLKNGYKLVDNPYNSFVKGYHLRKANLPFKYEEEELETIKCCMKDKIFFGNNFISLKDRNIGWQRVKLRFYQEDLLKSYDDYRYNIVMFPRQSGKTTTTIVDIVHFLTFNIDKDCVVVAQSDRTVTEILTKIKEAFNSMPFFLQPGFISFTKKGLALDNGCRLSIGIASESTIQGFALDYLYIDEFAYVRNNLIDTFWANIYPTLSANPNSKCVISSTPNGRNLFHTLWIGAQTGQNSFHPSRIYWTDVPRDISLEEFKRLTIENVGLDGWYLGYECSFDVGLKSIFPVTIQQKLRLSQSEYKDKWTSTDNWEWLSQDVEPYNFKKDYFIFSADIAEGLGQDYSVLKIQKIKLGGEGLQLVQVGIYRDNEISEEDFAKMFLDTVKHFDLTKIKAAIEANTYGSLFFHEVDTRYNYDKNYSWFDKSIFIRFWRESKEDYDYGVLWNASSKKVGVKAFQKMIVNDFLKSYNYNVIEEYLNFGRQNNDTYKANYGHDDLVMTDVTLCYALSIQNPFMDEFMNNVKFELEKSELNLHQDYETIYKQKVVDNNYHTFNNIEHHVRNHEDCIEKDNNIYL